MKVLYADDDIQVRDYVSMLLEAGLDCEILEASSGNEALSILEFDSEIDFLITEVRMKGGNGNVVVDYLDHHKLDIPIVWLSDPENKDVMLVQEVLARSPLNAFVAKPFRDDQFFPVIDRILRLKADHVTGDFDSDEDVEFDEDDFDFDLSGEFEPKSSNSNSEGSEDWSYGFKEKKQQEEVLDYSLAKKRGEEIELDYSLKKNERAEEDAGYSLKREFTSGGENILELRSKKKNIKT